MIEVNQLTKRYARHEAVRGISFSVARGEIVGFLGPNGAGKTTTLRMLTGYLPPTSGSASIAGHDIFRQSLEARRKIGYMPENVPLYDDMRVREYLKFRAQLKGLGGSDTRRRVGEVIDTCGLGNVRRKMIRTLSKGYRQRVGLADALVHDPELLILDEPTNGLDPAARDDMLSLVRRIGHDFGIAVLVTSHLLGELERVSDHVVVLDGGRLLRASATTDFMVGTGTLLVEVLGEGDARARMAGALLAVGVSCTPRGHLLAIDPPPGSGDRIHDLIRDAACDAEAGIVRLQADHHRIEDVFSEPEREPVGGADVPAT